MSERRSGDKRTPMVTLLRAWAHNESNKHPYAAYTGPNKYLVDLLLDAADEHEAALASAPRAEVGDKETLMLCRQWLEADEGRSLEDVIRIDEMSWTRTGRAGFNERFVALCKAIVAATGGVSPQLSPIKDG